MNAKSTRKIFDNETSQAIGNRIREARGKATQDDFGKSIGVERATLANYEKGRRLPNDEILQRISQISGVSVAALLFGEHFTPFDKYRANIERAVMEAAARRPGYFPRFMISDDEYSLIVLVRHLLRSDRVFAISLLQQVGDFMQKLLEQERAIGKLPITWGEAHLERLQCAIEKGEFDEGMDPEQEFWMTFFEERHVREENEGPQ